MRRTYLVPVARSALASLVVALVVLSATGTSVASDVSRQHDTAAAADARLLQPGAGYGLAHGSDAVRALQRRLRRLAWQPGPADGLYGPRTEAAVARFQRAARLPADGVVGPQTRRALRHDRRPALRRGDGYVRPSGSQRVRTLQRRLRAGDLRPGPLDGRFGPRTEAAVMRLQRGAELPADGIVDATTGKALAHRTAASRPDRVRTTRPPRAAPIATSDTGVELPWALLALGLAIAAGWLAGSAVTRRTHEEGPSATPRRSGDATVAAMPPNPAAGRRRRSAATVSGGAEATPRGRPAARTGGSAANGGAKARPGAPPEVAGNGDVASTRVPVLGYVSAPEAELLDSSEIREQMAAIDSLCEQRGWQLVELVRDVEGASGKGLERPGLAYALGRVADADPSCLVVAELQRLSRSASELGRILEGVARGGGRLVAMDVGIDTAGRSGRVAANALISVSGWERERLTERTRKGLAAARAKGDSISRAAVRDVPALKRRIAAMRSDGLTLQAIADRLNDERVPTLRGGERWRPSSVQAAAGYRRPRRAPLPGGGSDKEGPEIS